MSNASQAQRTRADEECHGRAPPRLVDAGLAAALEPFDDPSLLGEGRVTLVSVEAVQQRFGARWAMRQEQVHDFTTRVLQRGVGRDGFFQQVSATDYLIVHSELGRHAAHAACLGYLSEVLHHFLGESHKAADGVLVVRRIGRGELDAETPDLSPGERANGSAASKLPERAAGAAPLDIDPATGRPWSPFTAGDGRRLRVSVQLEPVHELKRGRPIGFRLVQAVIDQARQEELSRAQVKALASADILQADLASLARGLELLRAHGSDEPLSLIAPISYTSLANLRGRAELTRLLKAAAGLLRVGVIGEINDIEGLPNGFLMSVVSLIKPFTLLVAGRFETGHAHHAASLRDEGLNAVCLEAPRGLPDSVFQAWAEQAVPMAQTIARSAIVYGVEGAGRLKILARLGVSHASLA